MGRFGDYEHLAHEVAGREIAVQATLGFDGAQHVFDVHSPDDPVRPVTLVDRVARVVACCRHGDELPQGHLSRERHGVGAGDHDLTRHLVVELEDRPYHLLLVALHHPSPGRVGDDHAHLLLGVRLLTL